MQPLVRRLCNLLLLSWMLSPLFTHTTHWQSSSGPPTTPRNADDDRKKVRRHQHQHQHADDDDDVVNDNDDNGEEVDNNTAQTFVAPHQRATSRDVCCQTTTLEVGDTVAADVAPFSPHQQGQLIQLNTKRRRTKNCWRNAAAESWCPRDEAVARRRADRQRR